MARVIERAGAGVGVVRDLAGWHRGQPSTGSTYLVMRRLHAMSGGRSSRAALTGLRALVGSPDHGPGRLPLDADGERALAEVAAAGIAMLPNLLDDAAIARIAAFARTAPAKQRFNDGSRGPATYDTRTERTTAVEVLEPFVLANTDVQSIIAHPGLPELARRFFGIGGVVHPPQLVWSCAGALPATALEVASLARGFHWDYDGVGALRLHMYLTDVDTGTAPMEYLAGSHRGASLTNREVRHAGLGVADEHVWRAFPRSALRTIVGPRGTTFVSNSQGLHRGTQPMTGDRLFLVMPIQASGFAGYQFGRRSVVPRDAAFTEALRSGRPEYRLFTSAT
jgi:hypothetical protein